MLDIENITVAYHGQPFLQDFSLHMKRGEIISLVGESGSGKTTAIRSILGLLPQEGELVSGDILFEGKSLPEYSEKEMQKLPGIQDIHDLPGFRSHAESDTKNRLAVYRIHSEA